MNESFSNSGLTVPLSQLDNANGQTLKQLFRRILATKSAEESFAMLIDGKPTIVAYMECSPLDLVARDDIWRNSEASEESMALFRSLREGLDLSQLRVKVSVRSSLTEPSRQVIG